MTDTNNVTDTFGGGAHRRLTRADLPAPVRPVPTFSDERDAGVISDSDRVVDQLKTDLGRHIAERNKPSDQPKATTTTPLKEIAQRIKKLVHDDGEQFGDELKAKITDSVSLAKALQIWATETLQEKEKEPPKTAA
jgi:hypothetical protein